MAAGDTPPLVEALQERAGEDKLIACANAFALARELGVPLADVGRACDELGIKVMQCQLGCF